jgi:hypothetical protein
MYKTTPSSCLSWYIVTLIGLGDQHTIEHEEYIQTVDFEPFPWHEGSDDESDVNCHYNIDIYPSEKLHEEYHTNTPLILTIGVISVFCVTCLVFFCYDRLVHIRQMKVIDTAQRSNAIVASLFPADVRKRLMNASGKSAKRKNKNTFLNTSEGAKFKLKSYLNDTGVAGPESKPGNEAAEDKPIADLFPSTTVMFADICGFTACTYMVLRPCLSFVRWILGLRILTVSSVPTQNHFQGLP